MRFVALQEPELAGPGWQPQENPSRGVGIMYTPDMVSRWCAKLDVPLMIRFPTSSFADIDAE